MIRFCFHRTLLRGHAVGIRNRASPAETKKLDHRGHEGTRKFLFNDLTDLDNAGNVSVMAFVGNEVCRGGSEGTLEIGQSPEEEMSDGVIGRRRSRRKTANAPVDFSPDKPAGGEQLAREFQVWAKIVVPVETGARACRIHHAESNHGGKGYHRG
jgi:hypothetical protein